MTYLAGNLLVVTALVAAMAATGRLLDRCIAGGCRSSTVGPVWWFGLGAGAWMGVVFLLAAAQLLRPLPAVLVLVLLIAVSWRQRAAVGDLASWLPFPGAAKQQDRVGLILATAMAALVVVLWLQNQWPVVAWDADAYHLTVPRLYLEAGGFRRIPFNVYSNWPLNTQLLFSLALMIRSFTAAKLLHFVFGLATMVTIYRVVRRDSEVWAAWVGVGLFLLNPVVLDEMRVAYVDLAYTFFLFLAFVLTHRALEEPQMAAGNLLRAGILGGVAAGIKPTGLAGVACLAALYLVAAARAGTGVRQGAAGLLRLALPSVLLLAPWAAKSWVLTGNPAYPFFFGLFGGPEWSSELGLRLREWQQGLGMGRGWLDYLLLPIRVVLFGERGYESFDGRLLRLWAFLIPLSIVHCRRRPLIARSLGMAGLYFSTWALTSQQMRFLIPALPLLAVAAAESMRALAGRLPEKRRTAAAWGASLALLGLLVAATLPLLPQTGQMVRGYWRSGAALEQDLVHPVFGFIDRELPPDARLMFLNTNHGFFCRRDFIADSFFEASQINALFLAADGKAGIGEILEELGISHLLIENRDRYVPWPRSLFDYLNDPQLARPIYRSPDKVYDVVEIVSRQPVPD